VAVVFAFVAPFAVALAWVPVRLRFPNTDLALVLVGVVTATGALGRRSAVVSAAVSAAFWFEFFDTAPFERLAIARSPDVETTLVLAIAAIGAGELALRAAHYRRTSLDDAASLTSVRAAAALVASGEELASVVQAIASQLGELLSLESCTFEAEQSSLPRAQLSRDGTFVFPSGGEIEAAAGFVSAELPVVVQGEELGIFVLGFRPGALPSTEKLLAAVTLADNVGAAFLAQAPPPPSPPDQPRRGLYVVQPLSSTRASVAAGRQETAGLASDAERMIS
jgi:Domain of unknown function (DUF4118)